MGKSKPVTESDTVTQEALEKKQTCSVVWVRCHPAYPQHIIFFNIIVDHTSPGPLPVSLFCHTWPDVIHPAASWPPVVGQRKSCSLFQSAMPTLVPQHRGTRPHTLNKNRLMWPMMPAYLVGTHLSVTMPNAGCYSDGKSNTKCMSVCWCYIIKLETLHWLV